MDLREEFRSPEWRYEPCRSRNSTSSDLDHQNFTGKGSRSLSCHSGQEPGCVSVHTPRLNLKTVHHLSGKRNFRAAYYPGSAVTIAHRTSQVYSERERWSIKMGKACGVLKNHVTCLRLQTEVCGLVGKETWTQFKLKIRQEEVKDISSINEKLWMLHRDDTKVA